MRRRYRPGMKWFGLFAATALAPWVFTPAAAAQLTSFTSPSGNIGCIMDQDWVRCDIAERSWSPPPRPADCPSVTGYGQGIEMRGAGPAEFVCAGDTTLHSGPSLPYGHTNAVDGLSCASAPTGMTCTNRDNHGFTISRDVYRLF